MCQSVGTNPAEEAAQPRGEGKHFTINTPWETIPAPTLSSQGTGMSGSPLSLTHSPVIWDNSASHRMGVRSRRVNVCEATRKPITGSDQNVVKSGVWDKILGSGGSQWDRGAVHGHSEEGNLTSGCTWHKCGGLTTVLLFFHGNGWLYGHPAQNFTLQHPFQLHAATTF